MSNESVKRSELIQVKVTNKRWRIAQNNISRSKKNKDMSIREVLKSMNLDRIKRRKIIYVVDPIYNLIC